MHNTRRSSVTSPAITTTALPIVSTGSPYSPSLALSPTLSSSVGKSKRPSIAKARRLSSTAHTGRPGLAAGLSLSVPAGGAALSRGRATSVSKVEDDGELHPQSAGGGRRKDKGQTFECEKCSKVYRHSTCLTKHRWEHTAHWKEASRLLLSKHQQVQLLEGAAILAAASAGTSLPDEKSFWPAAVSPPASGLLGSSEFGINIHALSASGPGGYGSPRLAPSSLLSDAGDFDASRSELSIDEDSGEDDEDEGTSPRSGQDLDEDMEDGMFDLDLGGSGELPPPSPLPHVPLRLPTLHDRRASPSSSESSLSPGPSPGPAIRSADSGFGSLGRSGTVKSPSANANGALVAGSPVSSYGLSQPHPQPGSALGFFVSPPAPK
ncbi:hypothetical protein JCM11641_007541 [Rhodosporidiobolus odoratus]